MYLESRMWGHMSTTDLPGSSLLAGRYRLVERLGAGGMSVVWRGFDEVLGRQVAVKVLPPSTSADPSFRRRLRAEAQAAARLSHPHITNVYDYGEATTVDGEPVPYVVMELVDGESLAAVLARVRRLPWPAAVRICSEVSAALAAAHSRGIVHRDVTPANVMLTSSGAKVVDFGISALIGENDIDPDGSLLGTPAYLAPERLEGGQVSPATDVYAVGLLIYRTLIGQLPWDVGTTTALLRAHQYTEPEPLPHVEGLPAEVDALVSSCLEKRPADRPSSAEVASLLASIAAGAPVAARGYVPEWADSSEDTTILPSPHQYTDAARVRPGYAKVADSTPARAGRGVAQVRGGAMDPAAAGPAAVAGAAAAIAASSVSRDAPVSPAPGNAIPVSVSDVQAAVDGRRVGEAVAPQADAPSEVPPVPPSAGNGRGPAGGAVRNSRFGPVPARPAPMAVEAAAPAGAAAFGNAAHDVTVLRSGGGGMPPTNNNGAGNFGGSGNGRPRHTPGARRVLVMAGVVVALGAVTYAWSLVGAHHNDAPAPPSVLAAEGKCVVSYAVVKDDGKNFTANVTVANRDTVPAQDWKLWFVMPGDQTMSGNGKANVVQADQSVTVQSPTALDPQTSKTVQVIGSYKQSNAVPMVFQLNKQTCEAYVSGKPNTPSRPVERLTDGTVRLGPVPTTKNPAPGITIGPGGVAVPVPIKTSTKPSNSPSATPSASKEPVPDGDGDGDGTHTVLPSPQGNDDESTAPDTTTSPTPADKPTQPVIGDGGCDDPLDTECAITQ
jgi:hypothetical protein